MRFRAFILLVAYLVTLAVALTVARASPGPPGITKHDRDVIRFFNNHPKLARTAAGGRALSEVLPHVVNDLRRTQDAVPVATYPPHHSLWECIQRHEGAWDNHGPGHYGGLQMTWNWMGLIPGDAGDLSQAQQEWAAEHAWAANGYSYQFLYGQWYQWDYAGGCGTTG